MPTTPAWDEHTYSTHNPVTRRQAGQVLVYASWFVLLATAFKDRGGTLVGDPHKLGAENAVLHFVLPSLPAVEFGLVLDRLSKARGLAGAGTTSDELGALLKSRVARLSSVGGDSLLAGRVLDFWDRLS